MRPPRQVAEPAPGSARRENVHLDAIAIAQWRTADGLDFTGVFNLAHPAELLPQDFDLTGKLKIVRRVLVVAAAAALEQRAGRLDAVGRRFDYLGQARIDALAKLDADVLSGEHEGHQDHSAVQAA